jgi:hypothetical protein
MKYKIINDKFVDKKRTILRTGSSMELKENNKFTKKLLKNKFIKEIEK